MPAQTPWKIDVYQTEKGEKLVWAFIQGLEGRNKVEAIALVKVLEEKGNTLRRPQSGTLGEGLFELRGREVRIFYMFLPNRVIVLLDGEIKKRDDIPAKTLERMRGYKKEIERRGCRPKPEEKKR